MVALDQPFLWNRLGTSTPGGMIYALSEDVVPISGTDKKPGNVMLRKEKRPRPIVLRANVGDHLRIRFTNLLTPTSSVIGSAVTRYAGVHIAGLELFPSYDLRLMSPVNDAGGIPTAGKSLYIVAAVNGVLHFRIFDHEGQKAVDIDETKLTTQAGPIEDLRKQLEGLWPTHVLTKEETAGHRRRHIYRRWNPAGDRQ